MGRCLPAIRTGSTQRLRHCRSPRSASPARPVSAASLFFRAGARLELLGRWRHANSATTFLARHIESAPEVPEVSPCLGEISRAAAFLFFHLLSRFFAFGLLLHASTRCPRLPKARRRSQLLRQWVGTAGTPTAKRSPKQT